LVTATSRKQKYIEVTPNKTVERRSKITTQAPLKLLIKAILAITLLCLLPANASDEKRAMSPPSGIFGSRPFDYGRDDRTFTMQWHRSLPLDERDTGIGLIGGTEARALVGMNGKLYAAMGYWSDSKETDPRLPGGQVLVLDSPDSKWKVDLNLDDRVKSGPAAGKRRYFAIAVLYGATFTSDLHGQQLKQPVHMLLAGTWDRLGQLQVFSKNANSKSWSISNLSESVSRHAEIRSFFVYRDKITNIEHAFAGARINNVPDATRIYTGAFDPAAGKICWNEKPEEWGADTPDLTRTTRASGRITAFTECNGKLYASVYNMIFERQDGPRPSWKIVYKYEPEERFAEGSSGFRGLSAVPDRSGKQQDLLVTLEHRSSTIFRIDPKTFQAIAEINISTFLHRHWNTQVGYVIAGYNDTLRYVDPITSDSLTLIGLEAATPQLAGKVLRFNPTAHYLVRWSDGYYMVQEIADQSLDYAPRLQSVRSMVNSPFPQDPPGTVYASGYDANGVLVHNTAWIYRGVRTH